MKFCSFCGKRLEDNECCSCVNENKSKRSFNKKRKIAIIAAAVALVIIIISAVRAIGANQGTAPSSPPHNNTSKINPFDFVEAPHFDGYDGSGEISISIRRDDLICAIIGNEPDDSDWKVYPEWLHNYYTYDEAINGIVIAYSKNNELRNGDSVVVYITVPESLTDKIGNASKTYSVSGLEAIDYIEIFDNIQIIYDGVSGNAAASIDVLSNSDIVSACDFEITPNHNLSNGDQITVSITNEDRLLALFNVSPQKLSKTFTV